MRCGCARYGWNRAQPGSWCSACRAPPARGVNLNDQPAVPAPFEVDSYRTVERALAASSRHERELESEAIVKVVVNGETLLEVADAVNAEI